MLFIAQQNAQQNHIFIIFSSFRVMKTQFHCSLIQWNHTFMKMIFSYIYIYIYIYKAHTGSVNSNMVVSIVAPNYN